MADAIFISVEIVGAIIMIIISEDVGMFLLLMLLLARMLLLRDAITIEVILSKKEDFLFPLFYS